MQTRIEALGRQLLASARAVEAGKGRLARAIDAFIDHIGDSETLRVQALRLVDVLPALQSDRAVVQHLQQYFADNELPLPETLQWALKHADALPPQAVAPVVRRWVRWLGSRFISGEEPEATWRAITALHEAGRSVSLDLLGEDVCSETEADGYQQRYLKLIDALGPRLAEAGRPLHLSLKVSALDSQFTPLAEAHSAARIIERLRPIARGLMHHGGGLTLDMEHYDCKGITLRVLRDLLAEPEFRQWSGCGIALQGYLRETEADLAALIDWARERGTPLHVRLVRGAYWDTESVVARREGWPLPVWGTKSETDASYERCLALLIENHRTVRPVIASHNVRSLAAALALIEQHGLERDGYEFQMLYGMADGLQSALTDLGHPLRVYLPVGAVIPGMGYLVRRLLENSANNSFMRRAFAREENDDELLAPPQPEAVPPSTPAAGFRNEPVRRFAVPAEREALAAAIEEVRHELGGHHPLLIDGKKVDGEGRIESLNPAQPAEIVGTVAAAGTAEAELAIQGAAVAQQAWGERPAVERADILRHAAGLLAERRERFAALAILEAGKPWREADADIAEAIDYLRYYAGEAERLDAGFNLDVAGEENRYHYRPIGVAAIIPPWNFPLAILTGMTAAALATGNAAIVKPSSETPVIAAHLVSLLHEAGLPPGVAQFLPGEGKSLGEFLIRHPGVQIIAFTGSMAVGARIQQQAAADVAGQGHIKRVICEMGGKNAIIVDDSADPDDAVAGIIASAFGYAGQKCSACSRVIAVGAIHDTLVRRLAAAADSLLTGPPEAPQNLLGPVISAAAQSRIRSVIDEAKGRLPDALIRELPETDGGYYVGPAIFTDVPPDDELAQQEIFGPVLVVLRAADFQEALRIANGTSYALTGGLYSRTPAHLELARQQFKVGNLYLNRSITGAIVGRQPFGGSKLSGTGHKAGGPDYLLQFVQARTVSENTLRRGFAPDGDSH